MRRRLSIGRCGLVVLALVSMLCAPAHAAIIRVKWDSPTNGPGNTWANAHHTVTAAIAASVAGDEIWVAGDSAHPYVERITLRKGAGLFGGFAGSETQRVQRDWGANKTILDGSAGDMVTAPSGATTTTVLDGFTVQNGTTGIYCYSSSPSITNNTISGNGDEGIYCGGASPSIVNNTISGNGDDGIDCYNEYADSHPWIADNTIAGNGDVGIYCYNYSP